MNMQKIKVLIRGMHCKSCEIRVEDALKTLDGVAGVSVNQEKGEAVITFDGKAPSYAQIEKVIQATGYSIGDTESLLWVSKNSKDYLYLLMGGAILFTLYLLARMAGLFDLQFDTTGEQIWVALLVGLAAGVSSCMALIGGLILGFSARHAELHPEATALEKFRPHLFFNAGRLIGYAVLGGLIGLIGETISPSSSVLSFVTIVVGTAMMLLGFTLIEIFPLLKNKTITLPKAVSNFFGLRETEKEYNHTSAFTAGALTFFLPCGFTQAMQLYAISTGSFSKGALVMFLFALGTAPGLLGIGGLSSLFKGTRARIFFTTAGLAIIILGITTISNAGQTISLFTQQTPKTTESILNEQVQEIRMTQGDKGYSPNKFTIKKGVPVRWIINSTSQYSCANYLVMSKYGIAEVLKPGETVIEFTPTEAGPLKFACSMGMYRGVFTVEE
ncbi:MAG: Heavy metal transport/detoxification protein [Candidatus Wolfebacteria bacterium GW2011_GWC2_39_22]|uniref:Heavy metal transport/detoxification protein n=1 Tax=Candidatus Wolfebacteria bacterium GW2011_GWC2_39_22 TaxID=1619013 RepID=A0A0G0NAM6_9BACT|nr:MAG: Heavy metal transport/detoxification protein [Candidatus Wolfebacteria bacterium GW2011_GWC2_39_22]HBI25732.1 hypothetical protein [Candidatus Wolfebacteria bacterium]